ncbi:MAG: type IX secretion system membrane protein PorP/SprF [Sphingobacteriales bacterium]|nr:MAG: type IX secretion system membrane protein PorP/SprF [Sphingobacteriales bacterium]
MKYAKFLTLSIGCCAMLLSSHGQDLHFSQYFNSPLTTNPANTGFIPDADYRLSAQYRNQWSAVMAIPYKTMSIAGDAQLFRDRIENGWLGAGAVVLSDVAGSGSLRSTKIYGSVAYHQMLGNSSLLSAGFNLGWANKRIDQSGLKFPDQFDGKFFDSNIPTAALLTTNNVSYFDMQVGMNYAYFPHENVYLNAGYSIHHVNKPKETFFGDNSETGIVPMRHIAFANALLKVHEKVIISPNVYFATQAKATELAGGILANYNLTEAGEKQLIAGLYYRHKDAAIPMLGFEINNLRFTFSYDATISTLNNFNNYRGATEFTLVKKGFYPQSAGRQAMCPQF